MANEMSVTDNTFFSLNVYRIRYHHLWPCTINYGGMGQLSKLPGYRPVAECHRGNVILDLNSDWSLWHVIYWESHGRLGTTYDLHVKKQKKYYDLTTMAEIVLKFQHHFPLAPDTADQEETAQKSSCCAESQGAYWDESWYEWEAHE